MDKQHFDQLVKGVREMKRHMAGKRVPRICGAQSRFYSCRTDRTESNLGP